MRCPLSQDAFYVKLYQFQLMRGRFPIEIKPQLGCEEPCVIRTWNHFDVLVPTPT